MTPLEIVRVERGMTQERLSELSGVSVRQIRKFEKSFEAFGKSLITTSFALAEALDIQVEDIAPVELFKKDR